MRRVMVLAALAACTAEPHPLRDYRADTKPVDVRASDHPLLAGIVERQVLTFERQAAGIRRALDAISRAIPAERAGEFEEWERGSADELMSWQGTHVVNLGLRWEQLVTRPDDIATLEQQWDEAARVIERHEYEETLLRWLLEMDGWIEIRLACPSDPCVSDGIDVHGDAPVAAAVRASTALPVRMGVRRRVGLAPAGAGAGAAWAEPWFELAPDGALAVVPGVRRWPGIASAAAGLAASGITGLLGAAPAAVRSP
jgi:hypothetical protein